MPYTVNQGIVVAGSGVLNGRQIAAGSGAKIEGVFNETLEHDERRLQHLQQELDNLLVLVKKESAHTSPEATKAVEAVKEEVKKPEPNKLVVTSVLDSVAKLVTSFGTLSSSVVAVKELAAVVLK